MDDKAHIHHTLPHEAPNKAEMAEILKAYQSVALVFQGGGALGAYQAGVFEALSEVGIAPDWLSGVSIGAINAAIITGNKPGQQLDRLRSFWELVSQQSNWRIPPELDIFRAISNQTSAFVTMTSGIPGFFKPRSSNAFANPFAFLMPTQDSASYYDTSELRDTLNRFIDWDILNNQERRLSVGAVNVHTGNFRYFDTALERIGPEHIMASGALPPAFPAIKIENEYYWDGGIVSNTPLQYLLELEQLTDTLVFEVDLFSARGKIPVTMADVAARQKDIMYSSRTRNNTDSFKRMHNLRVSLRDALLRVPENQRSPEDQQFLSSMSNVPQINIIHLIYQQKGYENDAKDYEFSRVSMLDHWKSGLEDTRKTIRHRQWLKAPPESTGLSIHDVHRDDPN